MRKIDAYIKTIQPKTKKEEVFALSCLVLEMMNKEDIEGLSYMSHTIYSELLDSMTGSCDNDAFLYIVSFGEFSEFAHDSIVDVKNGKMSKKKAISGMLKYFSEYLLYD